MEKETVKKANELLLAIEKRRNKVKLLQEADHFSFYASNSNRKYDELESFDFRQDNEECTQEIDICRILLLQKQIKLLNKLEAEFEAL